MKTIRILTLAAAMGVAVTSGALAQQSGWASDTSFNSGFSSGSYNFEGFYAGVYGGANLGAAMYGVAGVAAGANFALVDGLVVGLEFQGGGQWTNNVAQYDALLLGRAGTAINSQMLAYASAGGGVVGGAGTYAVGGGAEFLVTNQIGVRGEVLATGGWGAWPSGAKATAGVLFHLK